MSESTYVQVNIYNATSGAVTLSDDTGLEWGKWCTDPPTRIATKSRKIDDDAPRACGRAFTTSGAQGLLSYIMADNGTIESIKFDIPYWTDNTVTFPCSGSSCSTYISYPTTEENFNKETPDSTVTVNIQKGGSPTVYWVFQEATTGQA